MAIIPSEVLDANEDVIAYYLAKKQWSSEEFAALFCGVNPLVWNGAEVSEHRSIMAALCCCSYNVALAGGPYAYKQCRSRPC